MKRAVSLVLALLLAALCTGCSITPAQTATSGEEKNDVPAVPPAPAQEPAADHGETDKTEEANVEKGLHLVIGETEVSADWEDNESIGALIALVSSAPLPVQMSMYGGFEQVGSLGTNLPRNDSQMTTQPGDIVLYSGNQIVIFYGSNSWAYTRLGRITDKSASELAELLSGSDVTITLSWE